MVVVVHQLRVIDTLRVHSGLDRRVVNHVVSLVSGTKVTPGFEETGLLILLFY